MVMTDSQQTTPVDHAAYDVTRYWGLPLYNDATPMDMRDGYNRAMRMIDKILTQLHTQIREKD
jgi:hypothetical protein|nr:MAG TPA_asm: hypothetical protein [Caudoviricetes sp.]